VEKEKNVKLIYSSPLWLIANGIRYSHNNHHLSDTEKTRKEFIAKTISEDGYVNMSEVNNLIGEKDFNLIKKVGFHMNHSSTLEHSLIVFDVKLSTKALLEWTRSRIGVAYTVTSSRYALDTMGIELEPTGDIKVDKILKQIKQLIDETMIGSKKKDFDKLAMLLPQAFYYKMQVSFNLRSLVHFLELRTNKSAHITIRKLAFQMIDELPNDYRELVLENEKIRKNYEKYKKDK